MECWTLRLKFSWMVEDLSLRRNAEGKHMKAESLKFRSRWKSNSWVLWTDCDCVVIRLESRSDENRFLGRCFGFRQVFEMVSKELLFLLVVHGVPVRRLNGGSRQNRIKAAGVGVRCFRKFTKRTLWSWIRCGFLKISERKKSNNFTTADAKGVRSTKGWHVWWFWCLGMGGSWRKEGVWKLRTWPRLSARGSCDSPSKLTH